ncbi:DUF59 domain-containing protein [Mycolicibacterium moriokaense]|nr:DUF59 domain-containing protein [Mycolicibacterium moriokaense]
MDLAAVRSAVDAVQDPELHRPLGELDMVRAVTADRRGRIEIEVALTTAGCPMTDRLARDVTAAAEAVPRVGDVHVAFTVMSEPQRRALADRFLASRPAGGASAATDVYAVASGKGGVGKSSVAANLAASLAREGKRVGLLDADVWGYSVPQLFGVRRSPIAMYQTMFPVQAHGVALMSLGFLVDDEEPIVWRGPMLHKALTQFVHEVHWGPLDVLLLDLPPGTGDVTLSVLELLPEASLLVVTTPQQTARAVASRVGVMARDVGMPVAGVVENMSELICPHCEGHSALFGAGGGERLAGELGAPLLGQVPLDIALREACDAGEPVVARAPESPSARALSGVAAALRPARRPLIGRALGVQPVG